MFNENLDRYDVKLILSSLNIHSENESPAPNGWITIKSPLREDNKPSFGLNVDNGSWKDHGTGDKGDIVNLVQKVKSLDSKAAIEFIKKTSGLNSLKEAPYTRVLNTKTQFWTDRNNQLLHVAQKRLRDEPNHYLLQQARDYDQLAADTLKRFGCGILNIYSEEWLAIPYKTGCQLYRRYNGEKVIRSLKGSSPGECFFAEQKISPNRPTLLLTKSPREAMLLHQLCADRMNIIGLATGEQATLSDSQMRWLKGEVQNNTYNDISLVLDCDTKNAYCTSTALAIKIKEIEPDTNVSIINVSKFSNGKSKDVADFMRENSDISFLKELLKTGREVIESKNTKAKTYVINPEDLRLPDKLLNRIPTSVKNYLDYCSPLSDVPDEFLITPFLAICGAAIGKMRYVRMGRIKIYPTIWTVLFAGSGIVRKSTALSYAKLPFKPIIHEFQKKYQSELDYWQQLKKLFEEDGETFSDPKPIKNTLYCPDGFSDLTFWESLRDNQSLVSMPTEFTALWNELTRPRNSMRDLALSMFDAEDSIRRITRSGGDIELENPVWCIASATTLENFQKSLSSNERSSGLLQRILPVCVEAPTKAFKALTELDDGDDQLYEEISRHVKRLISLNECEVDVSEEAKELYTKWSHELHNRATLLSDRITDIGGYTSRLNAYGLKFAMIFQQLDEPALSISKPNMEGAIELCEWIFNHVIYMLDRNYIFNQNYADRLKLRELIRKQLNNQITRTDLMNLSNFDKDQLDKAIGTDIEAGIIKKIVIDQTGGRPRIEYRLLN
jgi:hypothetical protein